MSDIKDGDLVEIYRRLFCCGRASKHQGEVFVVTRIVNTVSHCDCGYFDAATIATNENGIGVDVKRLRKVPPLSELEGQEREVTA